MLEGLKSTALLFTKKKLIAPISGFSNEILCIFAAQGIVNLGVKMKILGLLGLISLRLIIV